VNRQVREKMDEWCQGFGVSTLEMESCKFQPHFGLLMILMKICYGKIPNLRVKCDKHPANYCAMFEFSDY
jgi:hypothetical protein